jgi:outer membrane protein
VHEKSFVVSHWKRFYAFPVDPIHPAELICPRGKIMPRTSTRILLALLICTLPSLSGAAETTPTATKDKTSTPIQIVAPATPVIPAPRTVPAQPAVQTPAPPAQNPPQRPSVALPAVTATPTLTVPPMVSQTSKSRQVKLGSVDIARVSRESSLGKSSAAQAKQKQEKLQTQILAKRKQLEKQKAAIEAQIAKLPPEEREAKAKDKSKEFQKKVENFQKFGMKSDKELQAFQEGLGKSFNEAVEKAATEYGKAHGLALVVVKREMLYMSNSVDAQDVTDGIIKLMNEKWSKK